MNLEIDIIKNLVLMKIKKQGGVNMCVFCKGDLKPSITTYTVNINDSIIIIKNVPCEECQQCGEQYFSTNVTRNIENLVNQVKNALSEITIVDYNKQVA